MGREDFADASFAAAVREDLAASPEAGQFDTATLRTQYSRATFSSAGSTAARTTRARPHRFSLSTGFLLWGIALEPF